MIGRKKKPAKLSKKLTLKERITKWYNRNKLYLYIIGMGVLMVSLVAFCIIFVPGTDSGMYYNNRGGI